MIADESFASTEPHRGGELPPCAVVADAATKTSSNAAGNELKMYWGRRQMSEYVLDLLYKQGALGSSAHKYRTHFVGPTKIATATIHKLEHGLQVQPRIIERFADGLHLNSIDRRELYMRYGDLLLGRHIVDASQIDGWKRAYLDDPDTTIGRIKLISHPDPATVRQAFGKLIRHHLWQRRYAHDIALQNDTVPICEEVVSQQATMRFLADQMGMTENGLHDAITRCSMQPQRVIHLTKLLTLNHRETMELSSVYVEAVMKTQFLCLTPDDIRKDFDPDIHTRLAHWLALATAPRFKNLG